MIEITATPYNWNVNLNSLALIVVDVQNDYCSKGFYMDKAGYDTDRLSRILMPLKSLLKKLREKQIEIIFTRHNDESPSVGTSQKQSIGWEIVSDIHTEDSIIFDKTTCSAFVSTEIDEYLKSKNITHLMFCGLTTDVCVHSTLRSANDLGYKCMLVSDCCETVNDGLQNWSLESVIIENGVFGCITESNKIIQGFR